MLTSLRKALLWLTVAGSVAFLLSIPFWCVVHRGTGYIGVQYGALFICNDIDVEFRPDAGIGISPLHALRVHTAPESIGEWRLYPLWIPVVILGVLAGVSYCTRWLFVTRKATECSNCGYDLTGNLSGICPECGVATVPHTAKRRDAESVP